LLMDEREEIAIVTQNFGFSSVAAWNPMCCDAKV